MIKGLLGPPSGRRQVTNTMAVGMMAMVVVSAAAWAALRATRMPVVDVLLA